MTAYRRNFVPGWVFLLHRQSGGAKAGVSDGYVELLRGAFRETHQRHPFTIEAVVVLPDHLHTVWTLPEGDADFAMRWQLIKSTFRAVWRATRGYPEAARRKVNGVSGNADIGGIPFATKPISRGM
jgi:putative transposase